VTVDFNRINGIITDALHETIDFAADIAQENLSTDRYYWPRTTYRKNGEVVGTPRNARDEDTLYNSQYTVKEKNSGTIGYSADHAIAVHEGEPELDRPGRPFLKQVIEERGHDIARNFADNIKKKLS